MPVFEAMVRATLACHTSDKPGRWSTGLVPHAPARGRWPRWTRFRNAAAPTPHSVRHCAPPPPIAAALVARAPSAGGWPPPWCALPSAGVLARGAPRHSLPSGRHRPHDAAGHGRSASGLNGGPPKQSRAGRGRAPLPPPSPDSRRAPLAGAPAAAAVGGGTRAPHTTRPASPRPTRRGGGSPTAGGGCGAHVRRIALAPLRIGGAAGGGGLRRPLHWLRVRTAPLRAALWRWAAGTRPELIPTSDGGRPRQRPGATGCPRTWGPDRWRPRGLLPLQRQLPLPRAPLHPLVPSLLGAGYNGSSCAVGERVLKSPGVPADSHLSSVVLYERSRYPSLPARPLDPPSAQPASRPHPASSPTARDH